MKRYTVEDLKAENTYFTPTLNGWTCCWIVIGDDRFLRLSKEDSENNVVFVDVKTYLEASEIVNGGLF